MTEKCTASFMQGKSTAARHIWSPWSPNTGVHFWGISIITFLCLNAYNVSDIFVRTKQHLYWFNDLVWERTLVIWLGSWLAALEHLGLICSSWPTLAPSSDALYMEMWSRIAARRYLLIPALHLVFTNKNFRSSMPSKTSYFLLETLSSFKRIVLSLSTCQFEESFLYSELVSALAWMGYFLATPNWHC